MALVFFILITIVCIALGLIVLIQNPKGGGLSGSIAGFNSQFMGVKQTNDVLEKGTWLFASLLGVLCIVSVIFLSQGSTSNNNIIKDINTSTVPTQPAAPQNTQSVPPNTLQLPADSGK